MNRLSYILLFCLFLFSSCSVVLFEYPQPKVETVLNKFPANIRGVFVDSEKLDTIRITEKQFEYGSSQNTLFYIKRNLNENNTILKKLDNYFIISIKDNNGYWYIIPFQMCNQKLSIYIIDIELLLKNNSDSVSAKTTEQFIIEKVNQISTIKEVKEKDKQKQYIINPTKKELLDLFEKGLFSKVLMLNKID